MADQGAEGLLSPYLRKQRLKAAVPHVNGRVLDVGCGSGAMADLVPADRYIGVDVDDDSITEARRRHPQHHFQAMLPPAEPAFDTIVSLAVIEHVKDPGEFLRDLALRLLPGSQSCIVLTTPHPAVDWVHTIGASVGLFSRHASEEHEQLLAQGSLTALADECGLKLNTYRRFLLGANQLAVFRRKEG